MTPADDLLRIAGALEEALDIARDHENGNIAPDDYGRLMAALAESHADLSVLAEACADPDSAVERIQQDLEEVRTYLEAERVAS